MLHSDILSALKYFFSKSFFVSGKGQRLQEKRYELPESTTNEEMSDSPPSGRLGGRLAPAGRS